MSRKVNLLGQHPASAQLWLVTNYYTYPEPTLQHRNPQVDGALNEDLAADEKQTAGPTGQTWSDDGAFEF